ncbi:replication-associated protein [Gemycircularvirus recro1]|uniref:Replication-associated protein n=2 Tax=Genomoviridae TaxID=1910928 RepID=A0A2K9YNC5_9VIRU|nr:replication-associated protein [Gemycircularvirus sp.]AUW34333.1 replication-associated protein [Gemycircularvirus sp.]
MPEFDFHARYGLFTYSQCDGLDAFDVVDHFSSLAAECIIGRERHADEGTHLHCFVDFGRKRRFRRHVFADVGRFHPNIQPSRGTPGTAYDYAIKDGDVVGGGLERPDDGGTSGRRSNVPTDNTMATLVSIEDEHAFWDAVREMAPGLLLRNHPSLESYAKRRFAPRIQQYCHPQQLVFRLEGVPELDSWREDNLLHVDGSDGRSEAMRYKDADYAIFDDMQLKYVPQFKNWLGCQANFQVKVLYKDPVLIEWGKPCIWLSNDDPRHEAHLTDTDIRWLEGNCTFIHLTEPIVHANTE